MQVEPPGQDVPDHRPHEQVGALRLSAALGAAALALASTGHLLVVGALLALVVRTRFGTAAALVACTAVLVRWGAPTLSAVGGAQAVLGPGVVVGSTAAAASTGLAALSVVLLAPPLRSRPWDLVIVASIGVVAGAFAAGPAVPNDIPVRIAGCLVAVALALGASRLPWRGPVAAGALASASMALVLAGAA